MPHVCVLQLLLFSAFRLSSIRTVLLSGFVVLFSHLEGSVLLRVVFIGLLSNLVHFGAFSLAVFCLAIVVSVFVLFSIS